MKKMNNKGFSLVELIIVIAIMAILSAALAPQLMKYIEKSRVSTDKSSCDSIKSCVNTALAEEKVYTEITTLNSGTVSFKIETSGITLVTPTGAATNAIDNLKAELQSSLGSWPKPKSSGAQHFVVTITLDTTSGGVKNVAVDTNNGVMSK